MPINRDLIVLTSPSFDCFDVTVTDSTREERGRREAGLHLYSHRTSTMTWTSLLLTTEPGPGPSVEPHGELCEEWRQGMPVEMFNEEETHRAALLHFVPRL